MTEQDKRATARQVVLDAAKIASLTTDEFFDRLTASIRNLPRQIDIATRVFCESEEKPDENPTTD